MEKVIVLLAFCIGLVQLHAQESDYSQIETTVNYYLEGGTNNDFETLKKAFHADASMTYVKDGAYTSVNALEFFSKMKPGPKNNRTTKVLHITMSGNAANAQLEIYYPEKDFAFIDFMNLLKIDGEWKIVNKIFHRKQIK